MPLYRVTKSPFPQDQNLPWEYEEDSFISWVDEVFLEGYKKDQDEPFPSADECLDILRSAGYDVEYDLEGRSDGKRTRHDNSD